jgi:hypothetical protein
MTLLCIYISAFSQKYLIEMQYTAITNVLYKQYSNGKLCMYSEKRGRQVEEKSNETSEKSWHVRVDNGGVNAEDKYLPAAL